MDCTRLTRTQLIDELKKQQQCVQALEEADAHRKQAVEELRRSEQMFRGMVENANDIIYTLSTDGTLLYVSPNWTENLGHDVSEVVGRVFIPFVHPDDVPRCLAFLDKVLKTGKKQRGIEYRVKHKDGSWRWHTSNGSILKTSQGETIYAGIAHDITERKRFEAELEQKNAELEALLVELSNNKDVLQAIFDSSPSALVMANRDGVIAACNRQIKEFFGIEIGETMHTHVLDLAESIKDCFQDRGGFTELARRLQEHPDPSCFEPVEPEQILARAMRLERPKRKDISLFSLPVLGRKGQEMGRLWVFLDMTKQKQADEQLHTIVEVSPVPLIITRVSDGEILFANQPLGTLVGVAPKDLIGRRSPDFYSHAEDRMLILERLARDGYLRNHEVRLKRLDGSTF
ncbi:MAG: PAS domain S-box protein, partial [Acidobacteriota bacterium]